MPGLVGSDIIDVRHTDREVILVKVDKGSNLNISNAQVGHFNTNCTLPTAIGNITIDRGWVSIDVKYRGNSFRFLSTHLDGDCLPYFGYGTQNGQAQEIIDGLTNLISYINIVGRNGNPMGLLDNDGCIIYASENKNIIFSSQIQDQIEIYKRNLEEMEKK